MELDEQVAWLEGNLYEALDALIAAGDRNYDRWVAMRDAIPEVLAS